MLVVKPEQKKKREKNISGAHFKSIDVIHFSDLPDMHIAKDTFLKNLFLKESKNSSYNQRRVKRNKKKDTTEHNNANETEDEEDDKHSKERLKDQWKALFKTIVFERGNLSRDIDTKAIPITNFIIVRTTGN
ncbi:hypothetical protein RFI_28588 [Reticulomyxa filosa]|uniref:Uncharacterized protein n=1 Tax=Reticulomyxa filosa TaxID=46433 RepID=X6M4E3_RETFI|nr:hypothetical protein RFI_28588 [Reticulomyxa filosa]|eukprot:ETO08799.1 hypothetical protein RFI_28588 [Reticulomyxa filosa]